MKLTADILARTAWFVDYDGTLCPHQEVWEERTYDAVTILETLVQLNTRCRDFLWNTGRRPESLAGVQAAFLNFPGYFIQGSCYWDPKAAPPGQKQIIGPLVPQSIVDQAERFAKTRPDYRLELKPTSLRLTLFQASQFFHLDSDTAELRANTPPGWKWRLGNRGAELLAEGFDKATAVQREMARLPSDTLPVALGDDILDRPAIEEALKRGGYAVIVGDGCGWITQIPHNPDQLTVCAEPQDVLNLIDELVAQSATPKK